MAVDVPNWFFSTWAFIGFMLCMIPLPWHIEGNFIVLKYCTLCNVPPSLEHGHLPVHDLDGPGMLEPIHQFRGLEFGRHQQGTSLVRYLYVFLRFCILGVAHRSHAATQFMIGSAVAIPAASLCINRRLYQIASVQSVTKSRAEKRRDVIIDLAIGIGLPILGMIIREYYRTDSSRIVSDSLSDTVVQSHRFMLFEEVGCFPFTLNTPPAYPLFYAWPIFIGLVSASYCSTYAGNLS